MDRSVSSDGQSFLKRNVKSKVTGLHPHVLRAKLCYSGDLLGPACYETRGVLAVTSFDSRLEKRKNAGHLVK